MSNLRAPKRRVPVVEALEARVLFSADPAPLVVDQLVASAWVQAAEPAAAASPLVEVGSHAAAPVELVVIDSRVEDQQSLIADLSAQQQAGRSIAWLVVDADQDGLNIVSSALQQYGVIDSLHLVAHGQAGSVQLGSGELNVDSLRARAAEVSEWGGHFSERADILIYGCDLASDANGLELIDALGALTGADIAASSDLTGSSLLGGDWILEQSTGVIESGIAFSVDQQAAWGHLLNVVPSGAEMPVNATTTGVQSLPAERGSSQLAALPGGNAFVVWHDGQDNQIWGRFLDPAGAPSGGDILLSNNTGNTSDPAVAFDSTTSKLVVVWAEQGTDGDGSGIYSRTVTLAGATSAVTRINALTAGNQYQPSVSVTAGSALFSWTDDTANANKAIYIRGQGINSLTLLPVVVASGTGGGFDRSNSVTAVANTGDFLVVWQSEGGQDGDGAGIYARAYTAIGIPWGGEFRVNTTTAADQVTPTVVATGDGGYVLAWSDTGLDKDIHAQRISRTGALVGSEFVLNSLTTSEQNNVHLAATPTSGSNIGGFVATWQSLNQAPDVTGYGVFAREFYGDARAIGVERLINTTTDANQDAPSVVVAGSAGLVVWNGKGILDANDIQASAFDLIAPQLNVTATSGLDETSESGGTVTLQYRLATEPTANVVVTLTSSDTGEGTPLTTMLTFTPADWNLVQNVIVQGVDDAIVDGLVGYNISATFASADAQYNTLPSVDMPLFNVDDDSQNIIVVDTTSDVSDGVVTSIAGLINARGADGKISLREAIAAANATTNAVGGLDTIRFDPALAGLTIALSTALPSIDTPMHIDAVSMAGYTTHPLLTLTRSGLDSFDGLVLAVGSNGSIIEGLAVGGFDGSGIAVASEDIFIRYNHIGIDAAGNASLSNSGNGLLLVQADDSQISHNVISDNSGAGIYATLSNRLEISGNSIGVNAAQTVAFGNAGDGILLFDSNQASIDNNVIGANGLHGVRLTGADSYGTRIVSNSIGTDATGTLYFGNQGDGVVIDSGASNNQVGGTLSGAGNRIANNLGRAIHVWGAPGTTTGNALLGNLMDNNAYGIQLGSASNESMVPLANDVGDGDAGANNRQNTPVLYAALAESASSMRVTGELRSEAATIYTIELFADATPLGIGHGEAQVLLESFQVTTDATGFADFNRLISHTLSGFQAITATATRYDSILFRSSDTSEFAQNVPLNGAPVWVTPGSFATVENLLSVLSLTATDPDAPISYSIVGGADAARFNVVGNLLSFNVNPDFENPNSALGTNVYELVLRATDGIGASSDLVFSVSVMDSVETVVWNTAPNLSTSEGALFGQNLSATDPEGAPGPIVFSIVGGADASRFSIVGGALQFVVQPDFEQPVDIGANNVYDVIVRAIDGGGDQADRAFAVTVTNFNEAPVFDQAGTLVVAENQTAVQTLSATDPESSPSALTFSIIGGADAGKFSLNPSTGELSFVTAPDFEAPEDSGADNVYDVVLGVADPDGAATLQAFQIRVDDVAEPVNIVAPPLAQTQEDQPLEFNSTKQTLIVLDVPASLNAQIQLELTVSSGGLTLTPVGSVNVLQGSGGNEARIVLAGSLIDVNATLERLVFTPPANDSGTVSMSISAMETGSPAPAATRTIAINVVAVNDAPVLERAAQLQVTIESATVLSQNELLVSDIDDVESDLIFTIFQIPADVELRLNGQVIAQGSSFTQADINAGRVTLVGISNSGNTGIRTDQMILTVADRSGAPASNAVLALQLSLGNSGGSGSGTGGSGSGGSGGSGGGSGGPVVSGSSGTSSNSGNSNTQAASSGSTNSGASSSTPAAAAKDGEETTAAAARAVAPPVTPPSNQNAQAKSNTQSAITSPSVTDSRATAQAIFRELRNQLEMQGSDQSRLARFEPASRNLLAWAAERDVVHQSMVRNEQSASIAVAQRALLQKSTAEDLDRFREQLKSKILIEHNFAASSAAVSASISIGYVIWLLRGGVLLSSLLATIPAWSAIDPLPVLSNAGAGRLGQDNDDESLQEMLKKAELERERGAAGSAMDSTATSGELRS